MVIPLKPTLAEIIHHVPGGTHVFPVHIEKTLVVGDFKKKIEEKPYTFATSVEANYLVLYSITIAFRDKERRVKDLEKVAQQPSESELTETELNSEYFGGKPPLGRKYYVIAPFPHGEPIY